MNSDLKCKNEACWVLVRKSCVYLVFIKWLQCDLSALNGALKTRGSWSSGVYWLAGGMGLIDCRERGKEIKEKEQSQECQRKGWWGEKEEESRERGEIQRLGQGVSFCSPLQQLSFEHLLGASPRARQWVYGSKQRRQNSSFYQTYLLLGEIDL